MCRCMCAYISNVSVTASRRSVLVKVVAEVELRKKLVKNATFFWAFSGIRGTGNVLSVRCSVS